MDVPLHVHQLSLEECVDQSSISREPNGESKMLDLQQWKNADFPTASVEIEALLAYVDGIESLDPGDQIAAPDDVEIVDVPDVPLETNEETCRLFNMFISPGMHFETGRGCSREICEEQVSRYGVDGGKNTAAQKKEERRGTQQSLPPRSCPGVTVERESSIGKNARLERANKLKQQRENCRKQDGQKRKKSVRFRQNSREGATRRWRNELEFLLRDMEENSSGRECAHGH